ncbi:MAG: heparan-alpha-glucosaminide N-acetyltransferase domain-containing protein [Tenuifilaceae bacterium]|jgi:predicted acyltransferase|nr:heparan-alpha-glucosaminide N-acetyltransferase domain-containing protein [Tenuifilaceae bacterium]
MQVKHSPQVGENSFGRLISLDVFRGITVVAMIVVNSPGSWSHVYAPLLHKDWHGVTPTDFIFPFFLFIVGVSIALAYTKQINKGIPNALMYRKLIIRSVKIFALGLFLNLWPQFNIAELRVAGVLQRIAIVFLVCGLLFIRANWKKQAVVGAVILVGYWLAMVLIPTPGYGKAMLEPGTNLAAWIDRIILPGRMWQTTWDPEGLFSTLPAIASGITGLLAGRLIVSKQSGERKILYLFTAGFIATIVGYAWGCTFPMNKPLWTSSYVLFTSGMAAMVLGVSMFLVDILGYTRGTKPWLIFGSNAIAVYVMAGMLIAVFYSLPIGGASLNVHYFNLLTGLGVAPKLASLTYALLYVGLLFVPAAILYNRKIFVKL